MAPILGPEGSSEGTWPLSSQKVIAQLPRFFHHSSTGRGRGWEMSPLSRAFLKASWLGQFPPRSQGSGAPAGVNPFTPRVTSQEWVSLGAQASGGQSHPGQEAQGAVNSGCRHLPSGLVKSNGHNCILLTLIPLAGLIAPGIASLPALPLESQRGCLPSWCRVGKPLQGGQGLWQPPAGWRRFPCAPPPCLQGRAEKKLRDSQEQLAKLSSARAGSKL